MADILTFDEPSHTYRVGGVVRPSVTQVLSSLSDWGMVPKDALEAAQERGTNVHAICQYHDEGDLDDSTVGDYRGYLNAWLQFSRDFEVRWDQIEHRMYSTRFGFCGTPDRRGTLRGMRYASVDIKTGKTLHRVCGLQAAAYRQLATEEDPAWITGRRATVQLGADGKYKFLTWDSPTDWPAFLSLINLTNWVNE
jgi:hypothetical protein